MGTSTVSSKKRGRAAKSALAVVLALALALGGTFATFYGTQMGLNEGARTTSENPGGRVHDDFGNRVEDAATGKVTFDKNVYAESFVDRHNEGEYLVARIRLKNYAEINTDANNPGHVSAENKTQGTYGNVGSYTTVAYDSTNGFQPNLSFNNGAAPQPAFDVTIKGGLGLADSSADANNRYKYMPTFNKAMNGTGATDVDVKGKYPDYKDYPNAVIHNYYTGPGAADVSAPAYYDNGVQRQETHAIKQTVPGYRGVTTLTEWSSKPDGDKDNWWVYDEAAADPSGDGGWFYWSSPLSPDSATGLLIDGLEVAGDDLDWYYALNVEGEFITVEGTPRDSDAAGWYWCKDDGGVTKRVPSQGVSDLIDFVQDPSKNYKARVAMAIDDAAILKDVPTPDSTGAYAEALVDLSEVEGGATRGEEVYVLYKDVKNRKALVITRYLSSQWGTSGFGPFDTTGETDWNKSEAKKWCENTYYANLPAKLKEMIPVSTVRYRAMNVEGYTDRYNSSDHVFFMGRIDSNCEETSIGGAGDDLTIADTTLFANTSQMQATLPGSTTSADYWHRTALDKGNVSVTSVSGDSGADADTCQDPHNSSNVRSIGARPMFWINY